MDGVFVVKLVKYVWSIVLLLLLFCLGILLADKITLQDNLIRLHVVANSDTDADQQIKLCVRDAIVTYLSDGMQDITDSQEATRYIRDKLPEIEKLANNTLQSLNSKDTACVSLTEEEFGTRVYDTFSLPSGVYNSLRIVIGDGEGKNWWCVVFPSLCLPTTTNGFQDTAVSSGFDQGLVNSLTGEDGYEIRFFFLDCLGKLENFFHFE